MIPAGVFLGTPTPNNKSPFATDRSQNPDGALAVFYGPALPRSLCRRRADRGAADAPSVTPPTL